MHQSENKMKEIMESWFMSAVDQAQSGISHIRHNSLTAAAAYVLKVPTR